MIAMNPNQPAKTYDCATCGKANEYHGGLPKLYPFCSDRCKLVDLGRWFNGEYSIETPLDPEMMPDVPPATE